MHLLLHRIEHPEAKPRRTGALVYPMLLILLLAVIVALNFVNNGRVKLLNEDVTITSLSKDLEKFRILHISDLHGNEYGANQSTISTMLKTARYNAVCITGDVCAPDGNYDAFLKLIDVFAGRVPVYFVAGDEDPAPIAAQPDAPERVKADYVLAAEEHGAIYLDSPQKLTVGKSAVWFCPESMYGLDIDSSRAAYQARHSALANQPQTEFDYSVAEGDFWLDYTADTGDGWDSTYAVAHALVQPTLVVEYTGDQACFPGDVRRNYSVCAPATGDMFENSARVE